MILIDGLSAGPRPVSYPRFVVHAFPRNWGADWNTVRHLVLALELEHQRLRPRAGARRSA